MSNDLYPELQDLLSATLVGADRGTSFEPQLDLLPRDRKAFEAEIKKDKRFTLPAGSLRPYQLWFGFLKAALQDPDLRVDRECYEPWGPVETMTFAQWWPDHWRKLFAIDRSIRVAECPEDVDIRDGVIWVRLPLSEERNILGHGVKKLLMQRQSGRAGEFEQGRFGFDCSTGKNGRPISPATRFLKNLDDVELDLFLYVAWLHLPWAEKGDRKEFAARFYDVLMRECSRGGKHMKNPNILAPLRAELVSRGGRRRVPLYEQSDKNLENYRRAINRYLDNARAIAGNVAQGQFPGRY